MQSRNFAILEARPEYQHDAGLGGMSCRLAATLAELFPHGGAARWALGPSPCRGCTLEPSAGIFMPI